MRYSSLKFLLFICVFTLAPPQNTAWGFLAENCLSEKCIRANFPGESDPLKTTKVDSVGYADSLMINGEEVKLWGIHAPMHFWPQNDLARETLEDFLDRANGRLQCRHFVQDMVGQKLAQCFFEGEDIAAHLVKEGLAGINRSISLDYYADELAHAKANKKGIWDGSKPPDVHLCPQDARICPDGTVVGRQPPDCASFKPCPGETGFKR